MLFTLKYGLMSLRIFINVNVFSLGYQIHYIIHTNTFKSIKGKASNLYIYMAKTIKCFNVENELNSS